MPKNLSPMLATLVKKPFSDPNWIYERKLDGIRCLVYKKGTQVKLYSRNHKLLNHSYPELVARFQKEKTEHLILDGEIVSFEGELTSFSKLQERMHIKHLTKELQKKIPVIFYAFDLLQCNKKNLRNDPLDARKKQLKTAVQFGGKLRYLPHIKKNGEAYFNKACKRGWEGVIAKKAKSPYLSKRTRYWQKFKCGQRQEFVIAGFTSPQKRRKGFGALILGYYEKGVLKYAGKVGTGFSEKNLLFLEKKLKAIERKTPCFQDQKIPSSIHYVQPKYVCEIAFTEWTKEGRLRHPSFLGLRTDKEAKKVKREYATT